MKSVVIMVVFGISVVMAAAAASSSSGEYNGQEKYNCKIENLEQKLGYSKMPKTSPQRWSEGKNNNLKQSTAASLQVSKPQSSPPKRKAAEEFLSEEYYSKSCPQVETVIHNAVLKWVKKDFTLAASLIRLHFHDCMVRGCDASILLKHKGSERESAESQTLRGFEVVDDIKKQLERVCPKTVSCADILTSIACDATIAIGGPFWSVPLGRKDGLISRAKEADLVPGGHENVAKLIQLFQSKGLNILDLVALSGAHTIGRGGCHVIQDRLYNYNNTRKPDPNMDPAYLKFLRGVCKDKSKLVQLDPTTPKVFDVAYYKNVQRKKGLFTSDETLYVDDRTRSLVDTFASQPSLFSQQFSVSMISLGNLQVLTGSQGQVRTNCNFLNPARS